jgi:hypothetical protein
VTAILEKLSAGGVKRKHTTCQALKVIAGMVRGIESAPRILMDMIEIVGAFWAGASRHVVREAQPVVNDGNVKQVDRLNAMVIFFLAALEVDGQMAKVYGELIFEVVAAALFVRDSDGTLSSPIVTLLCALARSDLAVFEEITASLGDEFHTYMNYLSKVDRDALGNLIEVIQAALGTDG